MADLIPRLAAQKANPRLWVERLAIFSEADREHCLRSLTFRRGINLVWAREPDLRQKQHEYDLADNDYHMYQHVLIANTGEFGGSTAQAPYQKEHDRLIAHVHGNHQIAISLFEVDLNHFGPSLTALPPESSKVETEEAPERRYGKTKPAGLKRKPVKS